MMWKYLLVVAAIAVVLPSGVGAVVRSDVGATPTKTVEQVRLEKQNKVREQLGKIPDAKKREKMATLTSKACEVSKKRMDVMRKQLTRMGEILDRVETKSARLESEGKDVSSVDTAVSAARAKMATALTAVNTQANKVCEVNISGNESALSSEATAAINSVENQVSGVKAEVNASRELVVNAIKTLAAVAGVKVK